MPIARILLVNAGTDVRAAIAQGFPSQARDGGIISLGRAEAVRQVEALRPDVILVDAHGVDEPSLLAALHEPRPRICIPVILLTTADDTNGITHLAGVAGAVRSSLAVPELARAVQDIFAESRVVAQLARLEELGGDAFVQEMIDLFLATTPQRLTAAREGLTAGNLEMVERAVHSLKSSAGNLGADRVQELAGRMEELAEARQGEQLPALLRELEAEVARMQMHFARARRLVV